MAEKESLKEYKHRLDDALGNDFLRQAMDNFAVAYRASRENAFSGIDVDALVRFNIFFSHMALRDGEYVDLAVNGFTDTGDMVRVIFFNPFFQFPAIFSSQRVLG